MRSEDAALPVLILSDGRKGHLNQSIALARHLGMKYEIAEIRFSSRLMKMLSYLLDRLGIYCEKLYGNSLPSGDFSMVVAAGSGTYYAARIVSVKLGIRSVAMMYPKGYRPLFDTIFAQSHDTFPQISNVVEIPVNFSFSEPAGLYAPEKKAIGIVIGGENSSVKMPSELIRSVLDEVFDLYEDYEIAVTTSPRTPSEIEDLLEEYDFTYKVVYSSNPVNPIPDFLFGCEKVLITEDSTSMISEAVCAGNCCVEVIGLEAHGGSKFSKMANMLEMRGCLRRFDASRGCADKKVDLSEYAKAVKI